jgi:hypothetical protein
VSSQYAPFVAGLIVVVFAISYIAYFVYRRKMAAAGGPAVYHRQLVERRLGLSGTGEHVTAAWTAVTVPEETVTRSAIEVASGVVAGMGGVGVKFVGRPLLIACTTEDRLIYLDRESEQQSALTRGSVHITDTGRQGSQWTEEHTFGFVAGQVLRFDFPRARPLEVDIIATAAPTLVAWSNGAGVARLNGPFPPKGTY